MLPELRALLTKQKYKLIGNNAAAKLCAWTKTALRGNGFCYKQKFYGIQSHRCLQMTPCVNACTHQCAFCWRAIEFTQSSIKDSDDPKFIVDEAIRAQRLMLSGFGGYDGVDKKKLEEAQNPNQVAISLSGEPTLYNHLPELIDEFRRRKFTTFVVSNGTNPKMLEKIAPTQLYVTLAAPNEKTYKRICNPRINDGWKRINESLEILAGTKMRTAIRLTLVRKLNMHGPKEYARLIEKSNCMFVEAKAYMSVGSARQRLDLEFMPRHDEIVRFAKELKNELGYVIVDEQIVSRVVLLCRDDDTAKRRFINLQ